AAISGLTVYGFTALLNPFATTFGWGYAYISLARSLHALEGGALSPLVGRLVDRWPARRLIIMGVTLTGLGLICLSQTTNLVMFYASFLIMGLGGSLSSTMVPTATIVRWFKRNVGKANGILAMGLGIGGVLVPLVVKTIDTYGWQTSLVIFAAGLIVLGISLSFVFRNRPGDYGLLIDGRQPYNTIGLNDAVSPEIHDFSLGVKEALKTKAFWMMGIAYMLQAAGGNTALTHIMPYLDSLGMERATAGMVAMLIPLVSLTVRLPYGWLADIFKMKYMAATAFALSGLGLFLFSRLDPSSITSLILAIIFLGLGIGGVQPLRAPVLREYYGPKNFGTLFGLNFMFMTMGMVIGAPLAGWIYDTRGMYDPIWLILSAGVMVGAILMFSLPPSRVRNLPGDNTDTHHVSP
ncbi:MFS transporter, partial [Chloroflexota bacterium]